MKTSFNVFPSFFLYSHHLKKGRFVTKCVKHDTYMVWIENKHRLKSTNYKTKKQWRDKCFWYITGILSFIALQYIWNIWTEYNDRYVTESMHTINQHWWHEWPGGQKFFSKYNNILASISLYTVAQLCTQGRLSVLLPFQYGASVLIYCKMKWRMKKMNGTLHISEKQHIVFKRRFSGCEILILVLYMKAE